MNIRSQLETVVDKMEATLEKAQEPKKEPNQNPKPSCATPKEKLPSLEKLTMTSPKEEAKTEEKKEEEKVLTQQPLTEKTWSRPC